MFYFVLYLFLETIISSQFASVYGGFAMFITIVLTFILGVLILANFKNSLKDSLTQFVNKQLSYQEFTQNSVGKLVGALLLMIPGIFTDILGILLQFNVVTLIITRLFKTKMNNKYENNYKQHTKKEYDDDIIDTEIIDNYTNIKH